MTVLHWLAGKQSVDPTDGTVNEGAEPPETPAPVFAVRAFKHAIFGTPQTVQQRSPRRNSNTEHTRPRLRQNEARPSSSSMPRPNSVGDLQLSLKDLPDPPSSPGKGILLTPGTARAERKTVTFGQCVVDKADKRLMKSGLPDDYPGKFPSPWTKITTNDVPPVNPSEKSTGRSSLTERLEQAREQSAKSRSADNHDSRSHNANGVAWDVEHPTSECGKYWKAQFDVYRENTQREVKKLVMKQRAAKDFARDRDLRCTEVEDQLRQEKEKSAKLERLAAGLEARLRDHEQERDKVAREPGGDDHAPRVAKTVAVLKPPMDVGGVTNDLPNTTKDLTAMLNQRMDALRTTNDPPGHMLDRRQPMRPSKRTSPDRALESIIQKSGTKVEKDLENAHSTAVQSYSGPSKVRLRPELDRGAIDEAPKEVAQNPPCIQLSTNRSGRGEIILNTRTTRDDQPTRDRLIRHDSAQQVTPAVKSPQLTAKSVPMTDSPIDRLPSMCDSTSYAKANERPPKEILCSSPFEPNAPPLLSSELKSEKPSSSISWAPRPDAAADSKENVKPTTAWSSIGSKPRQGRRITSNLLDRNGKEISEDRVAAARARLLSKGRNVS